MMSSPVSISPMVIRPRLLAIILLLLLASIESSIVVYATAQIQIAQAAVSTTSTNKPSVVLSLSPSSSSSSSPLASRLPPSPVQNVTSSSSPKPILQQIASSQMTNNHNNLAAQQQTIGLAKINVPNQSATVTTNATATPTTQTSNTSSNLGTIHRSSGNNIIAASNHQPISISKLVAALPYGISLRNVAGLSNSIGSSESASNPTIATVTVASSSSSSSPTSSTTATAAATSTTQAADHHHHKSFNDMINPKRSNSDIINNDKVTSRSGASSFEASNGINAMSQNNNNMASSSSVDEIDDGLNSKLMRDFTFALAALNDDDDNSNLWGIPINLDRDLSEGGSDNSLMASKSSSFQQQTTAADSITNQQLHGADDFVNRRPSSSYRQSVSSSDQYGPTSSLSPKSAPNVDAVDNSEDGASDSDNYIGDYDDDSSNYEAISTDGGNKTNSPNNIIGSNHNTIFNNNNNNLYGNGNGDGNYNNNNNNNLNLLGYDTMSAKSSYSSASGLRQQVHLPAPTSSNSSSESQNDDSSAVDEDEDDDVSLAGDQQIEMARQQTTPPIASKSAAIIQAQRSASVAETLTQLMPRSSIFELEGRPRRSELDLKTAADVAGPASAEPAYSNGYQPSVAEASNSFGHHSNHHDGPQHYEQSSHYYSRPLGGKYYQYSSVPAYNEWKFGYRRGNPYHTIERHEHGRGSNFHTRVKWSDKYGLGYGLHVWDYNHADHHKDGHGHNEDNYAQNSHSNPINYAPGLATTTMTTTTKTLSSAAPLEAPIGALGSPNYGRFIEPKIYKKNLN